MKKIKIIFALLIYLNIGFWGGISWHSGIQKTVKGEELSFFERIQIGPKGVLEDIVCIENDVDKKAFYVSLSTFFWPAGALGSIADWVGGVALYYVPGQFK